MPRKPAKRGIRPRGERNNVPPHIYPQRRLGVVPKPAVDPKIKGDYMKAQTERLKRLAKPLGLSPDVKTVEELRVFLNDLLKYALQRKVEPAEMRALTDACEVLRKMLQKSDLEKTVDELLERSRKQAEISANSGISQPG